MSEKRRAENIGKQARLMEENFGPREEWRCRSPRSTTASDGGASGT